MRHLCREHGVLHRDVFERPQDWLARLSAFGPYVPLEMTNPQHKFGDGSGSRVDLNAKKLVRIDRVTSQP
jgi:hypothetical protein